MINLLKIGRVFYGIAIAGTGVLTVYYHAFPYIFPTPEYIQGQYVTAAAYIWGAAFVFAGTCITLQKMAGQISLLFGGLLLLLFCFYYVPYEFLTNSNYTHLEQWENAEKELALAGGAIIIAGSFSEKTNLSILKHSGKLIWPGAIVFAIPMLSFGLLHFTEAKDASTLIPAWIPNHMFWIYFAGAALIGSAIGIILKVRTGLIAALLGIMIFSWFVCLHIPRVIVASSADLDGELTSAFLALAYSGTAFVISGNSTKSLNSVNTPLQDNDENQNHPCNSDA